MKRVKKQPLCIMLVEDNEHDRVAFHRAFQKSQTDCKIIECIDAEEALKLLNVDISLFDLVVVDHGLPGMLGLDLCKELLNNRIPLPLVLMTGAGSEKLAIDALKTGVYDYVIKDSKKNYLDLLPVVLSEVVLKHSDRSGRIQAEEEMRKSEEKFRQLVENINEIFWMENLDNKKILYVSTAYERIMGRTCKSLYENPENWIEAIHPEDKERVIDSFRQGRLEGKYSEEFRIIRPDGTVRWILDRSFPVLDAEGKAQRVAGLAEDITERKEREEELRKHRNYLEDMVKERTIDLEHEIEERKQTEKELLRKTEELNIMNKELNELAIEMTRVEERERKRLAEVLHESIGQNLVAIKIACETGEYTSEIVPIINETIETTRSMTTKVHPPILERLGLIESIEGYVKSVLKPKNIKVSLDIDRVVEDLKIELKRDIFRIIRESLQNILKHASASRVKVKIKKNKRTVQINVKDNGVGFATKGMDRNVRAGIGIVLMKEQVRYLNGRFDIKSQPGNGVEVIAELPDEKNKEQRRKKTKDSIRSSDTI